MTYHPIDHWCQQWRPTGSNHHCYSSRAAESHHLDTCIVATKIARPRIRCDRNYMTPTWSNIATMMQQQQKKKDHLQSRHRLSSHDSSLHQQHPSHDFRSCGLLPPNRIEQPATPIPKGNCTREIGRPSVTASERHPSVTASEQDSGRNKRQQHHHQAVAGNQRRPQQSYPHNATYAHSPEPTKVDQAAIRYKATISYKNVDPSPAWKPMTRLNGFESCFVVFHWAPAIVHCKAQGQKYL